MNKRHLMYLTVFLGLACSEKSTNDTGDKAGDGGSAGSGGTTGSAITGVAIDWYTTEAGESQVPYDGEIVVGLPQASGTLLERRAPVGPDGKFSVADVPANTAYYIRQVPRVPVVPSSTYTTWDVTDQRELVLSNSYGYRANLERPTEGTMLDLRLTGLDPWAETDLLEFCAPSADAWFYPAPISLVPVGQTEMSLMIDLAQTGGTAGLVSAAQGDRAFVAQYRQRAGVTGTLFELQRAVELAGVEQVSNAVNVTSAALTTPPVTESATLTYAGAAYAALAPSLQPKALLTVMALYLAVDPTASSTRSPIVTTCDLAWLDLVGSAEFVDGSAALSYQNPFPQSWSRFAQLIANYSYKPLLPDGQTVTVRLLSGSSNPVDASGMVQMAPSLGPVSAIKIQGQAADVDVRGVGLTPEVSWSPPTLGTALSYSVDVRHVEKLVNDTGTATYQNVGVGWFTVATTSVRIPAGILQAGESYVIRVRARTSPHWVLNQASSYPSAFTDAGTGLIVP